MKELKINEKQQIWIKKAQLCTDIKFKRIQITYFLNCGEETIKVGSTIGIFVSASMHMWKYWIMIKPHQ